MNKYVVIYKGLPSAGSDPQATTAAWRSWFDDLGSAVLDAGNPFSSASVVVGARISSCATRAVSRSACRAVTNVAQICIPNSSAMIRAANGVRKWRIRAIGMLQGSPAVAVRLPLEAEGGR